MENIRQQQQVIYAWLARSPEKLNSTHFVLDFFTLLMTRNLLLEENKREQNFWLTELNGTIFNEAVSIVSFLSLIFIYLYLIDSVRFAEVSQLESICVGV